MNMNNTSGGVGNTPCAMPTSYYMPAGPEAKDSQYVLEMATADEDGDGVHPILERKYSAYVAANLRSWLPATDSTHYQSVLSSLASTTPPTAVVGSMGPPPQGSPVSGATLKARIAVLPDGRYEPCIVNGSMYLMPLEADTTTARANTPKSLRGSDKDAVHTAEDIVSAQENLSMSDMADLAHELEETL